jgi:hypothetical protein
LNHRPQQPDDDSDGVPERAGEPTPEQILAADVLRIATDDYCGSPQSRWRGRTEEDRASAAAFLRLDCESFLFWCATAGLDPRQVLRGVERALSTNMNREVAS